MNGELVCSLNTPDLKVVRHSRYVIFQLAEGAVPRQLFAAILGRIHGLAPAPTCVLAAPSSWGSEFWTALSVMGVQTLVFGAAAYPFWKLRLRIRQEKREEKERH